VGGHHLLCRVRLDGSRHRHPQGVPLQTQLLESAGLQAQAAALPVAAHALGLLPAAAAAPATPMPLYASPLYAALFCLAFVAANLLIAAVLLRRRRHRSASEMPRGPGGT